MIISGLVESGFEQIAKVRSARVFHPVGITFSATLEVTDGASRTADALGTGTWPVVARASKGIGTPQGWPDFYGIAVRLVDEVGPVDLLFATVARMIPYVLVPARDWDSNPYTTVLPYRASGASSAGTHRIVLRLEPERRDRVGSGEPRSIERAVAEAPLTFGLWESAGLSWNPIGRLVIESVSGQRIAFDPVENQHANLRHSRLLRALRSHAYIGSRRGRRAAIADLVRRPRGAGSQSPAGGTEPSVTSNSSSQELQR